MTSPLAERIIRANIFCISNRRLRKHFKELPRKTELELFIRSWFVARNFATLCNIH